VCITVGCFKIFIKINGLIYNNLFLFGLSKSCDSSFSIVLGYELGDWGSRVQFPVGAGNSSLHHCIQNGSEAHPASYPVGTSGSFPVGKAAGA
jgi:hypothetical protein